MTMSLKNILYEKTDHVAKVIINRPHVMNAINREVYFELEQAFNNAVDDEDIRVIVVCGIGENFGSGHDIKRVPEPDKEPEGFKQWSRLNNYFDEIYWDLHEKWRNLPKPTIAMVKGYCLIGSWMLAVCCDLIIAAEDAKFADRVPRWGGMYSEYPAYLMDMSPRKAKEHLWTGDFISGIEAVRMGIANRSIPADMLEDETMKLAHKISLLDPIVLKMTKRAINQTMDNTGYSAAIRSLYLRPSTGGNPQVKRPEGVLFNVNLAKNANKIFDEFDKKRGKL
jgi:enoyl-CoA hydratase